jgi:hypothetical protein
MIKATYEADVLIAVRRIGSNPERTLGTPYVSPQSRSLPPKTASGPAIFGQKLLKFDPSATLAKSNRRRAQDCRGRNGSAAGFIACA